MRLLLDTNILIHREAAAVVREDIGVLFNWLDRIRAEKCIHPSSLEEIGNHADSTVIRTFTAKLRSYHQLRTVAEDPPDFGEVRAGDATPNDTVDSDLLREVVGDRVDLLLTEDTGIHRKARVAGVADRVLTIDRFLERVVRENPELVDYPVLSVRKEYFGDIDVRDSFFDAFRNDYPGFDAWFNRKADETSYVCRDDDGRVMAFLYLKDEGVDEAYGDIRPTFGPKRRLKVGTLKVVLNGYKIGERFLKIIFDNALARGAEEVYVTAFERTSGQQRLVGLLEQWGFYRHGTKCSAAGGEGVWVRDMSPRVLPDTPAVTYPFVPSQTTKYIVPIYPEFHTDLFPDSILRTESPMDFVENRPYRNAIRKAYISRSLNRRLRPGDVIVFYRTASGTGPAYYTSVATTIGLVESMHLDIRDFEAFRAACGAVSVFTDDKLREHWDYNRNSRPFVVRFLYVYSLPRRPNLRALTENGVIGKAPRGFELLTETAFRRLLEISDADVGVVVD